MYNGVHPCQKGLAETRLRPIDVRFTYVVDCALSYAARRECSSNEHLVTAHASQGGDTAIAGRIELADALPSERWLQVGAVAASRPAFSASFLA